MTHIVPISQDIQIISDLIFKIYKNCAEPLEKKEAFSSSLNNRVVIRKLTTSKPLKVKIKTQN